MLDDDEAFVAEAGDDFHVDQVLTNASPSAGFPRIDVGWHHGGMVRSSPPPKSEPPRRYRAPIVGWIFNLSILMVFLLVAVASIIVRAELPIVAAMWVMVLVAIYVCWTMPVTYVDIGPDDILIRTSRKTRIIAWDDLDEIRWVSERYAEFAYFCTSDGRQVKSPFGVSPLGVGERHVRRMVDDAEQTWRRHLQQQAAASRERPVRVFRRKLYP